MTSTPSELRLFPPTLNVCPAEGNPCKAKKETNEDVCVINGRSATVPDRLTDEFAALVLEIVTVLTRLLVTSATGAFVPMRT